MRKESMRLELRPSKEMDSAASNDVNEHNVVRLPNRARVYYNPSESWDKIYVVIKGAAQKKLRIRQAFKKDIASIIDRAKLDSVGFVTTKTYKSITQGKAANNVWVSEDSENVVIGCDPEFVLVGDDGVAIYADTIFRVEPKKEITDNISDGSKWARLGSDGPCAELRPDPSEDINVVIKNIKNLLTNNSSVIENFKWVGGASFKHPTMERRYEIGGHIHLGRPADVKKEGHDLISCQHAVGRILDEMVGVPMIRFDTPLPAERRKAYGRFGDLKSDDVKLEWRVPSGIWLVHPTLSAAVMSTTKAVAEEVWKRYKDRDLNDDFLLKKNVDDNIYKSFGCMNDETVRNTINSSKITDVSDDRINDFYGRYKKMSTYHKYKDNIDLFIKLCMSKKHPLSDKFLELRNGWLNNKQLPL